MDQQQPNTTVARSQMTNELITFFEQNLGEEVNAVEAYILFAAVVLTAFLVISCVCVLIFRCSPPNKKKVQHLTKEEARAEESKY